MRPSAKLPSEQLKMNIEDGKKSDNDAMKVQEQVEDADHVVDPGNCSSVKSSVPNTVNNEFECECLHEAVRHLNSHPIRQSTAGQMPGNRKSSDGEPETRCLQDKVWAIWFDVTIWVCD